MYIFIHISYYQVAKYVVGIINKPGVSPTGYKFKNCKDSAVIGFHNNCIMHIT